MAERLAAFGVDWQRALLGVAAAPLVVMLGSVVLGVAKRGAPFVRTARAKRRAIFEEGGVLDRALAETAAPPRASLKLVDLGSGDGALLRAALEHPRIGSAEGIEINPFLHAMALLASRRDARVTLRLGDLWAQELCSADVVVVYGVPPMFEEGGLAAKLVDEARPGTIVLSNAYPIQQRHGADRPHACSRRLEYLEAVNVETSPLHMDATSAIYAYHVVHRG